LNPSSFELGIHHSSATPRTNRQRRRPGRYRAKPLVSLAWRRTSPAGASGPIL